MAVIICLSDGYKNALKIREIESNIGVGLENRKENGGKMSVYSTKEIGWVRLYVGLNILTPPLSFGEGGGREAVEWFGGRLFSTPRSRRLLPLRR